MSDDGIGKLSRRDFIQVSAAATLAGPRVLAAAPAAGAGKTRVTGYLLARLREHGVEHLFGVPGATCDPLFAAAGAPGSPLSLVVTSSDLEAGYAADGYARMRGLSALSVTYGVGTLSLLSTIGGAYAERSPVVILNGGPSSEDLRLQRELGTLFSHSCGREQTDLVAFREVTAFAERAESAGDVPRLVDAALRTALTRQRPVYLEIPKHLWDASCPAPGAPIDLSVAPSGEEPRLAATIGNGLRGAKRPVVLLGIEVQRLGLADAVIAFLAKSGLPWATTFLAKSVIPEQTPGFLGVYGGEHAVPAVKQAVEGADALFALGTVMGRQQRKLVTQSSGALLWATDGTVRFGRKPPVKATLPALLAALQAQDWPSTAKPQKTDLSFTARRASMPAVELPPTKEPGLTYDEALGAVSDALDESVLAITDTSLSMYPAAELNVAGRGGFLCNAVWQAIGYSVGAAVGVAVAQARRPLVVCGDGGFQMTAQALSTMAQRQLPCIVVVLDNGLYGIEQYLLDGSYFADDSKTGRPYLRLNAWRYADLAKALGVTQASTVSTPKELAVALAAAKAAKGPSFICARIKPHDLPAGLRG